MGFSCGRQHLLPNVTWDLSLWHKDSLVGVREISCSVARGILVPRLGGPRLGSPPLGVYFKTAHFGPATLPVPSGHLRLVATFEEGESKSSDKWFCVFFLYDTVRPE